MMSAIVNSQVPRAPEVESSESVSDAGVASEGGEDFAQILAPQRRLAEDAQREGDSTARGADPSRRSETSVAGDPSIQYAAATRERGSTPAIKEFSALTDGSRRESLRMGQSPAVQEGMDARKVSVDSLRGGESKNARGGNTASKSSGASEAALSITNPSTNSNPSSNSNTISNMNGVQASAGAVATLAMSTGAGLGLSAGLPSAALTGGAQGASLTQSSGQPASLFSVTQPVGAEGWSQQLGDKILTVMRADLGEAVINLAPEELGPVKVSLTVSEGEVRLHWVAHASETRQALEQALPRLREMFAQEGLQLADSQVTSGGQQESAGNFSSSSETERGSEASGHVAGESRIDSSRVVTVSRHPGLLDLYA